MQAAWLWLLFCGALSAQASLSGTVVNDVTGEPVKRVAVTLTGGSAHDSPATLSDGAGKFYFAAVSPGRYRLTAEKAPFPRWEHGQRKPPAAGTSLELANGEQRTGVAIRLLPGASISGRVTDENNEPAVGAQVTLLRVSYFNGRRQIGAAGHATADDRGEYRLHSIPPGYRPAADSPDRATWLTIVPAAELLGINVAPRPVTTHRISGTVVDANSGQTVRGANAMLSTAAGDDGSEHGFVHNNLGTFTFPAITPGSYTITATRADAGQMTYEGDGVVDLSKTSVGLESNEFFRFGGRSPLAVDGTFGLGPLAAQSVFPQVMNLDGAYLRELRVNGQPVKGQFIDLQALSGTVRLEVNMSINGASIDGGAGNAVGATVILDPQSGQDFRRSRYRVAKSDRTGHFKLTGIAPGEYRLNAFEDIDDGAWLDSNYMATFSAKGELVKLAEKETRTLPLRMIAGAQ